MNDVAATIRGGRLTLAALVIGVLVGAGLGDIPALWDGVPMVTSILSGTLVLLLTILVIDEVLAYREARKWRRLAAVAHRTLGAHARAVLNRLTAELDLYGEAGAANGATPPAGWQDGHMDTIAIMLKRLPDQRWRLKFQGACGEIVRELDGVLTGWAPVLLAHPGYAEIMDRFAGIAGGVGQLIDELNPPYGQSPTGVIEQQPGDEQYARRTTRRTLLVMATAAEVRRDLHSRASNLAEFHRDDADDRKQVDVPTRTRTLAETLAAEAERSHDDAYLERHDLAIDNLATFDEGFSTAFDDAREAVRARNDSSLAVDGHSILTADELQQLRVNLREPNPVIEAWAHGEAMDRRRLKLALEGSLSLDGPTDRGRMLITQAITKLDAIRDRSAAQSPDS